MAEQEKQTTEKAQERGLVAYQSRDGQQIKLSFDVVRKYLVSGHPEWVTDAEIMLYAGECKARGLNPFAKNCYLVKYTRDAPAATIVSIDYYRSRARAQPDCVGWNKGIIVKTKAGQVEEREGSFLFPGDELLGGWFRARPKGWETDLSWSVNLSPYIKTTQEGRPTRFWDKENQPQQIVKVVESQGLRRCWPDEFAKLYVEEEVIQALPDQTAEIKMPKATDEKPETTNGKTEEGKRETENGGDKEADHEPTLFETLRKWIRDPETPEKEILATSNYISKSFPKLNDKDGQAILLEWGKMKKGILAAKGQDNDASPTK